MAEMEQLFSSKGAVDTTTPMYDESVDNNVRHQLLPSVKSISRRSVYAAIVLQIVLAGFLVVVALIDVPLVPHGPLSTTAHALYVTGSTILASAIATFTTSQVRRLYFFDTASCVKAQLQTTPSYHQRLRTILSLGSSRDNLRAWDVAGSFLLVGLITTAIVSGVTPSTTPRYLDTPAYLVLDDLYCWSTASTRPNSTDFTWKLSNGSYIGLNSTFDPVCPASNIVRQTQNLYNLPPDGWGYVIGETPVSKNALGAPNSVQDFAYAFGAGTAGWSAAWTQFASVSACFPSLISNPVRCQRAGNVTVRDHQVTVSSGDCSVTTEVYAVDPTTQGASSAGACTTDHDLGTATILIGSVNSHAVQLATAMVDRAWLNDTKHADHYAVTCTVDITPAIGFRNLTYGRLTASNTVGASYAEASGSSFGVTGSRDDCDMINTDTGTVMDKNAVLTIGALSAGASASWPLLSEGSYRDGWWNTLWQATQDLGGLWVQDYAIDDIAVYFAFNQSTNSLEDALGLASAMGLGMYYGTYNAGPLASIDAKTVLDGTRVGPGRRWALVYVVPELYAAVLLVVLLRRQTRT